MTTTTTDPTPTDPLAGIEQAAVLRPGDTLVLVIRRDVTHDEGERLQAEVAHRLPGVRAAFVANVEQALVYRPDAPEATTTPCRRCDGCGQIADTEDREPWTAWTSLPPESQLAVTMGLVKPITCDACHGSRVAPAVTL